MTASTLLTAAAVGAVIGVILVWWLGRRFAPPPTPVWQPPTGPAPATLAYRADPAMRLACIHLRPLEDEIRARGFTVHVDAEPWAKLSVGALDPGPEAIPALGLPDSVVYRPPRTVAPHTSSDPVIYCNACLIGIGFEDGTWGNDPPPFVIEPKG